VAITYENVFYDRVITSFHNLIAEEFKIQIYYDEHKGNQSFLITPISDELDELTANGQSRDYSISVSYQLNTTGNYDTNHVKQVALIAERMKRLIFNNKNYSVSGVNQFFNAEVSSIEYTRDENLLGANLTINVSSLEIIA
tara:strand:+ start:243 stop:665 length:423 start_codon:yes stop_codon:yes gene_type:complete